MSLFRPIVTIGSWTLISRFLGFVRTVLIAHVLGVGMIADVFFVAFRLANFFRGLLAEGAFNAAFVPLFSRKLTSDGQDHAVRFAGEVTVVLGSICLIFTLTAEFAMPWLVFVFAPGFSGNPEKVALTVELTRVIFPYFLFTVLVALMGGMLNSVHRFSTAAAAPILLNVVMISVLLALSAGILSTPGYALSWGVTVAGFLQLLWVVSACKRAGIMFSLPRPRLTSDVRRLLVLMGPALIGAGVIQINLLIDVILASTLQEGSISYLYYADRVYQLPLATVGIAVGVALLPLLSRQLHSGEFAAAQVSQNRAIEFVLTLTLPAAAALLVITEPIVIVLFQRGAFGITDVDATAGALSAYATGLPAYVLIRALTPGFFAREDTHTPVKIAIVTVIANIILAVFLMQFLAHVGIALATALTAWLNAGILSSILVRRGHLKFDQRLIRNIPRLLLASTAMAAILWWGNVQMADNFAGNEMQRITSLLILVFGGGMSYMLLAIFTGTIRLADIKSQMARRAD
jgi:putative peptidoglycan lipid II flippase